MRLPRSKDLSQLGQLTNARELAALADLARLAAMKNEIDQRILALKSKVAPCQDPALASYLSRWLDWRENQIQALTKRQALVSAEYAIAARQCGQKMAENAVMENLIKKVKIKEASEVEKRSVLGAISEHKQQN